MDLKTVVVMFSLINFTTGFLLVVLYLTFPRFLETKFWALGGLCFGISSALISLRGVIPDVVSIAFANTLIFLSTVLHVIGIKIYRSQKTRALEFLVFALLCGLPFFFIYDLEGGLRYRILISSFGIGVLSYVSFYLLISKNKKNFAEKLSSSAFLILGLIHSYRFFVFSGVHTPVDDFMTNPIVSNFLVFVVGGVCNIIYSAGYILLVSGKIQLELDGKNQSLLDEVEDKRRFLSMLTHELKTPLSVFKAVISSKNPSEKSITAMNDSVDEMDEIIQSCEWSAEIDREEKNNNFEKFDLNELLDELLKNKKFSKFKFTGLPKADLESDPRLLRVILSNLFDNASKYASPNEPIEVCLESKKSEKSLFLSVTNSISGNSKFNPELIFEKYYRGPDAHRISGSGLGLYIVKGLSEQLNLKLDVVLEENQVTFGLLFPSEASV